MDTPLYRPSQLENLKEKADYFDVPDIHTKIQTHNNPQYWLQQDLLQVTSFQYKFFRNITLTDDTIPQIKVFSHFLLRYFRSNYQLLWEQKDRTAFVNFPHVLTEPELLPFIIKNAFKHSFYKDFTTFPTSYFENVILNPDFIIEQPETSDNRPYLTTVIISPFNTHIVQETFDNDDNVIHHQPTTRQPQSHII